MFDMEQTAVKNFQNLMMHEGSQIPVSQISELMEKLTNTGIFIDLDYNSQDRNNWHCTTHAKRTVCLLSNPEVLKKSALRRKALAALRIKIGQIRIGGTMISDCLKISEKPLCLPNHG